MYYLNKINAVIGILSIILSIFGIACNMVSIIICLKRELRKAPTFIFKIFINIMNMIPLITIVLCPFITHFFELELNSLYFKMGKVIIFLTLWSSHSSAYLQVLILFKHLCNYYKNLAYS
jgi:hypothetical protein